MWIQKLFIKIRYVPRPKLIFVNTEVNIVFLLYSGFTLRSIVGYDEYEKSKGNMGLDRWKEAIKTRFKRIFSIQFWKKNCDIETENKKTKI